jgi:hypothetical protein
MFEQVQRQQQATVVAARTEASAQVIALTLRAHGIEASTRWYSHLYPALEWVEGYAVSVREEDEQRARSLLRKLAATGPDAVEVDDPPDP